MNTAHSRLVLLAICALVVLSVFLAGCSSTASAGAGATDAPPSADATKVPSASLDATLGPFVAGETVQVGPYQITMTRSRLLENPEPGPDLKGVPAMREGYLLTDIHLDISTTATDSAHLPPLPATEFKLQPDGGKVVNGGHVGITRSQPTSQAAGTYGPGPMMNTPVRPGETVTLLPQFVVPPTSEHLTLYFWPVRERPRLVVAFSLK